MGWMNGEERSNGTQHGEWSGTKVLSRRENEPKTRPGDARMIPGLVQDSEKQSGCWRRTSRVSFLGDLATVG